MNDNKLEQQVSELATLAKENPKIDVASLMINALANKGNQVSSRTKKWAYLVSVGLPPFGLLFALKFYLFSDEEDASQVGSVCVVLTVLAVGLFWIIGKMLLSGSGTSVQQLQQISPEDIRGALQ